MERWVGCPNCRKNVRLTDEELAAKRGFCALCDTRFDIVPEMLVGSGPFRGAEGVAALVPVQPPTGRIAVTEAGGQTSIEIRPGPIPGRLMMTFVQYLSPFLVLPILLIFSAVTMRRFHPVMVIWFTVLPIIWFAQALPVVRRALRAISRERLTVESDALAIERRTLGIRRHRTIAFADVHKAHVVDRMPDLALPAKWWRKQEELPEPQAELLLRGRDPIPLACGMHHDRSTLEWLVATIERATRRARAAGAADPAAEKAGSSSG